MEKYAVVIDPEKVENEKNAAVGKRPSGNPHRNVPLDPDKGTEPFEKRPEGKSDGQG